MICLLTPVDKTTGAPSEHTLLLKADRDSLAVPLRYAGSAVEFNCIHGVIEEGVVPLTGYTILLVPHADCDTRSVTVKSYRVGVNGGFQTGGYAFFKADLQYLVARSAGDEITHEDILYFIGVGQGQFQSCGYIGLPRFQHICHLLGISAQSQVDDPHVAMQDITASYDIPIGIRPVFITLTDGLDAFALQLQLIGDLRNFRCTKT